MKEEKNKKKISTWEDIVSSEPISGPMAGGRCRYTISGKEIISLVQGTIHSEIEEGVAKMRDDLKKVLEEIGKIHKIDNRKSL